MSRDNSNKPEAKYPGFAQRIRSVFKNTPATEIAKCLGCSDQAIHDWMNGLNLPNGENLLKIRERYQVGIDWLIAGEKGSHGDTEPLVNRDILNEHPYFEDIVNAANRNDHHLLLRMLEYASDKIREKIEK